VQFEMVTQQAQPLSQRIVLAKHKDRGIVQGLSRQWITPCPCLLPLVDLRQCLLTPTSPEEHGPTRGRGCVLAVVARIRMARGLLALLGLRPRGLGFLLRSGRQHGFAPVYGVKRYERDAYNSSHQQTILRHRSRSLDDNLAVSPHTRPVSASLADRWQRGRV
jgi:hypothetical protein